MSEEGGEVVDLDSMRPHVVLHCDDGVHVVPLRFFEDFADGKIDCPPDALPCLRALVRDWLDQ